jgi:RNA polymerase subunit RPABC4/transcription elongation factor Spt4
MTLDQETLNDLLLVFVTATGAVVAATWMGMILWTWRDMSLRSRDKLAQITASMLVAVLGIFGLIVYVMLRPQETLAEAYERSLEEEALLQNIEEKPICPGCGRSTRENWQVCPYCHTKLKKPCTHCGKMLELSWNLCPYCATSQIDYNTAPAEPKTAAPTRRRSVAARLGATPVPPPGFDSAPTGDQAGAVEFVDDDGY